MKDKMLGNKPLYVALAQRKEDRKAQLASQYMQRLAAMRMQNQAGMPGTMYAPAQGGFFVPNPMQNQRAATAFMQTPAAISGAQMRGAAPRWASNFNPMQAQYMYGQAGQYNQIARGPRIGGPPGQLRAASHGQYTAGNQMRQPNRMPMNQTQQPRHMQGQPGKGGQQGYQSYAMNAQSRMMPQQQQQHIQNHGGIVVQNQDPLTSQMLASALPAEQKQMLGERLYPLISRICKEPDVGKITGMMLEMDNAELLMMLENEEVLQIKVNEASTVLAAAGNQVKQQPLV